MINDAFAYIANSDALGERLLAHVWYTVLAVGIAILIALPIGLLLGHTRKGADTVTAISGALRAAPSLGLLTWLTLELSMGIRLPIIPSTIVLVVLAIPPILAATVAGMVSVPPAVVDSARAAGYSERHIVRSVELPLAAPSIIGGIRSATVQVIATATIVAYVGLSGLGRYLIDGLALRDYPQMLAGAILAAVLAIVVDLAFALLQRFITPKGI